MDINGTTNSSNPSLAANETVEVKIAKTAVCMFVLVVSLFENIVIFTALKRNATGRMRTCNSFFIANMTVADILLAVQNLPQAYNNIMLNSGYLLHGNLGNTLCKLDMFFSAALIISTNLTIVAIAIDRYFAVYFPLRKVITQRACRVLISLTWLISGFIAAPLLYYCSLMKVGAITVCHTSDDQAFKTWFTVLAGVLAVTLVLMLLLYTAIGCKLKHKLPPGNVNRIAQQRREKRNREIYKMLITLIVAYYACTLPYFITILSAVHGFLKNLKNIHFAFVASLMLFLNGVINPVVYTVFCKNFRNEVHDIFNSCIGCRNFNFTVNDQEQSATTKRTARNGNVGSHWKQLTSL